MKKALPMILICFLAISTFSIIAPYVKAEEPLKCPAGNDVQISNSYLILTVFDATGSVNLETVGGTLLLYPADTSNIAFNVDGETQKSTVNGGGLNSYMTQAPTITAPDAIVVGWEMSGVSMIITYKLVSDNLQVTTVIRNLDSVSHQAGVRFLIDTQLGVDDGAPLYAPGIGVKTYETDMPNPTFNYWMAYDFFPNPSVQAYSTLITTPDRVAFTWWPNSFTSLWDYTTNPNQRFYTPGYTYSPYSDSAVLIYYDPLVLTPNASRTIMFYYGLSLVTAWKDSITSSLSTISSLLDTIFADYANCIVDDVYTWATVDLVTKVLEPQWKFAQDYAGWAGIYGLPATIISVANTALDLWQDAQASSYLINIASANTYKEILGAQGPGIISNTFKIANFLYKQAHPELTDDQAAEKVNAEMSLMSTFLGHVVDRIESQGSIDRQTVSSYLDQDFGISSIRSSLQQGLNGIINYVDNPDLVISDAIGQYVSGYLNDVISEFRQVDNEYRTQAIVDGQIFTFPMLKTGSEALSQGESKYQTNAGIALSFSVAGTTLSIAGDTFIYGGVAIEATSWWTGVGTGAGALVAACGAIMGVAGDVGTFASSFMYEGELQELAAINALFAVQTSQFSLMALVMPDVESAIDSMTRNTLSNPLSGIPTGYISDIEPDFGSSGAPSFDITIQNTGAVGTYGFAAFLVYNSEGLAIAANPVYVKFDVSAGSSVTAVAPVPSFDSGLFGGVFVLRVELWLGPKLQPNLYGTTYKVGLEGAISDFGATLSSAVNTAPHVITNVIQGTITASQQLVADFTGTVGSLWTNFVLNFPGSQVDLHVYDSSGRHVGINYQTGLVDLQIPGANYSGSQAIPQWIRVPGGNYTVQVVGFDVAGSENFTVTAIETLPSPSILTTSPESFDAQVVAGSAFVAPILIGESSLQNGLTDIAINCSELTGPSGAIAGPQSPPSFDLAPGASNALSLTYDVPQDAHGIFTGTIAVTAQGNSSGMPISLSATMPVRLTVVRHDVAIIDVSPYPTWVYQDWSINVSATTTNLGDFAENATVSLYCNDTVGGEMIGAELVVLAPNQTETLSFTWNTTGVETSYNGYNITAVADISPLVDSNLTNNVLQSPTKVVVRIPCDMNGDGRVDIYDAITFSYYFGSRKGDARWNAYADMNGDGVTDIFDAIIISEHFGKSSSS